MNKKTNSVDVSHFWSNLGWRSFTGLIPFYVTAIFSWPKRTCLVLVLCYKFWCIL